MGSSGLLCVVRPWKIADGRPSFSPSSTIIMLTVCSPDPRVYGGDEGMVSTDNSFSISDPGGPGELVAFAEARARIDSLSEAQARACLHRLLGRLVTLEAQADQPSCMQLALLELCIAVGDEFRSSGGTP
jgi:hypothetical protein